MKILKYRGVDPGIKTGYAEWDAVKQQFTEVKTANFWTVYNEAELPLRMFPHDLLTTVYVIENPALNSPVFDRGVERKDHAQTIARHVGSNQREAQLLIEGIRILGYQVIEVKPKKTSSRKGKITHEDFVRLTRYKGRTSQHARDAAMMVFGRI